ncbi:ketosynthase chain-length factor [Streptomyces sp. 4N509B]|uniref:ketosynthase chain-length factor n=1 Tax=Streptomyces sp. 4N509B TaxID=3457413 RepID=UPI003FD36578
MTTPTTTTTGGAKAATSARPAGSEPVPARRAVRAVITGIGVAAPNGLGTDAWWQASLRGESGIRPVVDYDASRYATQLVGRIEGFEATEHIPGRLLPQTDRVTRLALTAGAWALEDAGTGPEPATMPGYSSYDVGVVTSNAIGGFEFTHREVRKLWTQGSHHVSVYESFAWFYAVNTGQLSIRHGMRGTSGVFVGEQAGGLDAIGHARRTLRKGLRLSITGGMESALDPWALVSHITGGRISRSDDAATAYLPFDSRAAGHVPGEGGAILVMEDAESATARGARVYGEIAGYAATFDPAPTAVRPGQAPLSAQAAIRGYAPAESEEDSRPPGAGLERAARMALADAGLGPQDIDVVFADAAAVPEDDAAEAAVLRTLFGPYGVPVTAPKTLTGRLYGGGAPLDVAAALLAIRDGVIPPVVGVSQPAPDQRLDLVREEPRPARLRAALVLARGRGGFNSAVVVRAPRLDDLPRAPRETASETTGDNGSDGGTASATDSATAPSTDSTDTTP